MLFREQKWLVTNSWTDINESKVPLATKFGMTDFINPTKTEDVVEAIIDVTNGGADYSFECIGTSTL